MIEKIKSVEREVENKFNKADMDYCGFEWFYKYHLCIVKDFALRLAKILNVDRDVVHLSAILHDIGYIIDPNNHVNSGLNEAKIIMKKHGFEDKLIKKVLYCIEMHDKLEFPKSPEARIIQFADIVSHTNPNFLNIMKK